MPTPTTTISPTTITDAAGNLLDLIETAVDGYWTYSEVRGRPTLENVDQVAVRFSRISTEGPACQRGLRAVFEVSVVICINDDVRKGVATADASGLDIAQRMWRLWGGLVHVSNQLQKTTPAGDSSPNCGDIRFGDFTTSYEAGRAMGRGEVEFGLETVPVALT